MELGDHRSTADAKIALFRSFFRGRDDVYPRRFESQQTGKSGYAPACANEWVRGILLAVDFDGQGWVERWVEHGEAPERVVAVKPDSGAPMLTHPLCVWPKTAQHTGNGSIRDAASSFVCKAPDWNLYRASSGISLRASSAARSRRRRAYWA